MSEYDLYIMQERLHVGTFQHETGTENGNHIELMFLKDLNLLMNLFRGSSN